MPNLTPSRLIKLILCIWFFTGCTSHEEKADTAFESYKNNKAAYINVQPIAVIKSVKDSVDTQSKLKSVNQAIYSASKQYSANPWQTFKIDFEKKLNANEKLIQAMDAGHDKTNKLYKKLIVMHKTNNQLKKNMIDFEEDMKLRLAAFSAEMNKSDYEIKTQIQELNMINK